MEPQLLLYFSLRNDSEAEGQYIAALAQQFQIAKDNESYHLALFAYHLLFISFFYQIFFKIKLWLPDRYHVALVSFEAGRRSQFREAKSPTDYPHPQNKESPMFEFLNVFYECETLVKKCKKLVKQRNERLGHVTYVLSSLDDFETRIAEYDQIAEEVHKLTQQQLLQEFSNFVSEIDLDLLFTKDDIESGLIVPHRLSPKELEHLYKKCDDFLDPIYFQIKEILQSSYGIA